MKTTTTVLVLCASALFACSGEGASDAGCSPDAAQGSCYPQIPIQGGDAGPIESCILGYWTPYFDPDPTYIGNTCSFWKVCADGGVGINIPECVAADCNKRDYLVYFTDGGGLEGDYFMSVSLGTFSETDPPTLYSYEFDGGTLFTDGELTYVDCTDSELVIDKNGLNYRASPGLAASLSAALAHDGGTWRGLPYSP